jgi:hypothetical protein
MSERSADRASMGVLEPAERASEVLFGLIMVLAITGSLSVADAGGENVRTLLLGALGGNFAWGLVDGVMYLMGRLSSRGNEIRTVLAVRRAADPEAAHRVIAGALPPLVASVFQPAELERVRLYLNRLPEPAAHPRLERRDWWGALGVFLLVFLSTLPVVLPFVFEPSTVRAIRVSNAIAIGMLFLTGYSYGRSAGYRAWMMGIAMVALGGVLVGVTIALGG